MKNLDLNAFGVQEMDTREMKQTDGGFLLLLSIAGSLIGAAIIVAAAGAIVASFEAGYNQSYE